MCGFDGVGVVVLGYDGGWEGGVWLGYGRVGVAV
jgi:hypothetical protein